MIAAAPAGTSALGRIKRCVPHRAKRDGTGAKALSRVPGSVRLIVGGGAAEPGVHPKRPREDQKQPEIKVSQCLPGGYLSDNMLITDNI